MIRGTGDRGQGTSGAGYRLTNCVTLLGAVAGGPAAHPMVKERIRGLMAQALTADKYLDAQGGRAVRREPSGVKALVEEIRQEQRSDVEKLLDWARERKAAGRAWTGVVRRETGDGGQETMAPRKPGGRGQTGETKAAIVKLLGRGPASAKELAAELGLRVNGTLLMLKTMWREGLVEAKGRPSIWKLGGRAA